MRELGDFAAAERVIAPTPGDCYPCLIARGRIAELEGQHARADYWFAKADAAGPSLPFASEAEGRALLDRGQPDAGHRRIHYRQPDEARTSPIRWKAGARR